MATSTQKKGVILTGDRPTGRLHMGHYVGSLANRIKMQNEYEQYIIIADAQALTDNYEDVDKVRSNIVEVTIDYLSCGIDPRLSVIFVQSLVPELFELTSHYSNLVTVARLERNPTVKDEIKQKNFERNIPVGFFCYPISQAADITGLRADTVPVGEDQIPMIEQTNEIIRRFHHLYGVEIFPEVKAPLSNVPRLPGIDGSAKMGKSLGNALNISASEKEIRQAVHMMFTDPKHLKVSDPGTVEGNVVFKFLDAFDPNAAELEELKQHYRRGGLGDSVIKKRLEAILIERFSDARRIRGELENDIAYVHEVLRDGTRRARAVVADTLARVRSAMGISYDSFRP
jgi:tryptophanyl-tRNA synthetase